MKYLFPLLAATVLFVGCQPPAAQPIIINNDKGHDHCRPPVIIQRPPVIIQQQPPIIIRPQNGCCASRHCGSPHCPVCRQHGWCNGGIGIQINKNGVGIGIRPPHDHHHD